MEPKVHTHNLQRRCHLSTKMHWRLSMLFNRINLQVTPVIQPVGVVIGIVPPQHNEWLQPKQRSHHDIAT
jgi:hypothetical protein